MLSEFLVLAVFPLILIVAAGWDLASYTVPNFIQAGLVATFAIFAFSSGMTLAMLGWHALAFAIALVAGFALFAFRAIGGGDAKFFAASALMFGFHDLLSFAVVASLFGGAFTLVLLAGRQFPLPQFLAQPWLLRLHDEREGVPYGVALAAGALLTLPHSEIFRLAGGV